MLSGDSTPDCVAWTTQSSGKFLVMNDDRVAPCWMTVGTMLVVPLAHDERTCVTQKDPRSPDTTWNFRLPSLVTHTRPCLPLPS